MEEQERRALRRKRNHRRRRRRRIRVILISTVIVFGILFVCWRLFHSKIMECIERPEIQGISQSKFEEHPEWKEAFLSVNEYSRPGTALKRVKKVYVHYTANPGTSADQNRSYFENLGQTGETSASAHFIIGYEGEIVQCVPLDEIAYAVSGENGESVSIECCYVSEDGSFTEETYDSLIKLLKWLTDVYGLKKKDILRHYDSNGKLCPIYYVEHEDEWEQLREDCFQ